MIGIIGAMGEEIELVKEHLQDPKSIISGGVEYFQGVLQGKPVVLCKTGIGKVNAAIAASAMIYLFQVKKIIFTGVAGSVEPSLVLGDIIIATDCLYHDMDATSMGWKPAEIPDGSVSIFPCDPKMSEVFYQAASNAYQDNRIYKGRIVTGDQFIADTMKVESFYKLYNAYAVDMESAAVAHVAFRYQIPCCIIRCISDKANDGASIDYPVFFAEAAKRSAFLVVSCVKEL